MREPVRMVRVITRLNIGGPSLQAALLSTKLDPQRWSTCLVAGSPEAGEGDLREPVQQAGARIICVPSLRRPVHPWRDAVAWRQLLRILWAERPHILHTHLAKAGTLGRLAGFCYNAAGPGQHPGQRAALIHTFHGHVLEGYFSPWASRIFITIERFLARGTDRLIAVSPAIRDELLRLGIGRPEQWRVIPLGLDLEPFAQVPPPPEGRPVRVGMVGRLVPIKNPALLLEALTRMTREQQERVGDSLIVGDGPLRPSLEAETRALGLQRLVQFTGWRRDVSSVYRDVDVVCLTSRNEGTPVSLIEAMASGRAVVATDVGGVRDLLDEPGAPSAASQPRGFRMTARGVLVRADDAQAFAEALGAVVCDGSLRRRLGDAARAYAVQQFGADRLIRDVTQLYEEVIR
ncbi:MAG: glycosyltransferase family 4 protein [Candidatus Omnitrophica bacterium]|nr:glycosyltransferase family 4 protein [Candidatus Omnitrophota bacterium]